MRSPIRSEPEAFQLTLGAAATIALAVFIGWLLTPLVGVALLAVIAALVLTGYARAQNPDQLARLREAAREASRRAARTTDRHVLVIANDALGDEALRKGLLADGEERVEVDVLVPVLTSRVHFTVSDIDAEVEQARERLERSLEWAREHGICAHGEIGDVDPVTAIEDALRRFHADEVVVITHADERTCWQERVELECLRNELDVPIRQVVAGERR